MKEGTDLIRIGKPLRPEFAAVTGSGELARLEESWREAEEIAASANNMFLPAVVTDFLAILKARSHREAS